MTKKRAIAELEALARACAVSEKNALLPSAYKAYGATKEALIVAIIALGKARKEVEQAMNTRNSVEIAPGFGSHLNGRAKRGPKRVRKQRGEP